MKLDFTAIIALLESNPTLAAKLTPATILQALKIYHDFQALQTGGTADDVFKAFDEALGFLQSAGLGYDDIRSIIAALKPLMTAK